MSEKHTRGPAAMHLVLGAALGVVGVLGYGALFANERGPGPGASRVAGGGTVVDVDAGELAAALRDLQRVLVSIEMTLERADASPPRATRTPVGTDGIADRSSAASNAELALADSLAEIAAALRSLEEQGARVTPVNRSAVAGASALVPPAWVDRRAAFSSQDLRSASLSGDEAAWEALLAAHTEKHLLWSQQEVLSAYGKPDNIWVSEQAATWQYRIVDPGEGEEEFHFRFHGGLVYSVSYDFDEE